MGRTTARIRRRSKRHTPKRKSAQQQQWVEPPEQHPSGYRKCVTPGHQQLFTARNTNNHPSGQFNRNDEPSGHNTPQYFRYQPADRYDTSEYDNYPSRNDHPAEYRLEYTPGNQYVQSLTRGNTSGNPAVDNHPAVDNDESPDNDNAAINDD